MYTSKRLGKHATSMAGRGEGMVFRNWRRFCVISFLVAVVVFFFFIRVIFCFAGLKAALEKAESEKTEAVKEASREQGKAEAAKKAEADCREESSR